MKYAKIIGEKEKAVESVKSDFLGVYRPAVILGNSNTPGEAATVKILEYKNTESFFIKGERDEP